MKYTYACFVGYAGFFHGLGLNKVEIDFTKCVSNIVLIVGKNASGKTTLMNALNLFPDGSSAFLPNMDAEKRLSLFDNGNIYDIQITSPTDNKGGRKVSKAFIKKNGLELNENGNISSYKDIIFSEFDLDANYISLSKLSSHDRGLGDKTPAERKKFVSNILDNLETYNNIYKTLNKKSLIFKSHINTLHSKIENIGNRDNVLISLNNLKNREAELNSKIISLNNLIVSIETKNSIDEDEANKIKELNESREELSKAIFQQTTEIRAIRVKSRITDNNIADKFAKDNELMGFHHNKMETSKALWIEKSRQLNESESSIRSLEGDLSSYESETANNSINNTYTNSTNNIKALQAQLKELGIDPNTDKFVLQSILEAYNDFIKGIDGILSYSTTDMLEFICINYNPNIIKDLLKTSNNLTQELQNNKSRIDKLTDDMNSLATLENRPTKCKIDSCPFIAQAIEVKNIIGNKNITKEFEDLVKKSEEIATSIAECNNKIELANTWLPERTRLDAIIEGLSKITKYTNFIPSYLKDTDWRNNILKMLYNGNYFNDMRSPKNISDGLELLERLSSEVTINKNLEIEYNNYRNNIKLVNSTRSMIDKLKNEQKSLVDEVSSYKMDYDKSKGLYEELSSIVSIEQDILNREKAVEELQRQLDEVDKNLGEYKTKSEKALSMLSDIQKYNNDIALLQNELNPLKSEISRLEAQLTLLDSYYNEYNQYNEKYNMIETIKKYCSPTGGGIQTVFMQLYMAKTLDLSNQLLGMLFNGEYRLLDFIINENEFRIPFMDMSGIPVEDVAFGSNSQVSMIGMVINLVLLYQASSKYNIARLDEISSANDQSNRSQFIKVLNAAINLLHMDQVFIISHDIELDNTNCDIIKLKGYEGFDDNRMLGNVIYDYNTIKGD